MYNFEIIQNFLPYISPNDHQRSLVDRLMNHIDDNFDGEYCSIDIGGDKWVLFDKWTIWWYKYKDWYKYRLNINFDIEDDPFGEDSFESFTIVIRFNTLFIDNIEISVPKRSVKKFKRMLRRKYKEYTNKKDIKNLKNIVNKIKNLTNNNL